MVILGLDFGTTFSTLSLITKTSVCLALQSDSEFVPTTYGVNDTIDEYGYQLCDDKFNFKPGKSYYRDIKRWIGVTSKTVESKRQQLKPDYIVKAGDTVYDMFISDNNKSNFLPLYAVCAKFILCFIREFEYRREITCDGLVISVPAQYTSSQRLFMKSLETALGIPVVHIMNEPSAALFSAFRGLDATTINADYIVYDFGGGTFDVSLISKRGNVFSVILSGGDEVLGGRDVDKAIEGYIRDKYALAAYDSFPVVDLKIMVSTTFESTKIKSNRGVVITLTPAELKEICLPFFNRASLILKSILEASDMKTDICLVPIGGSALLPGAVAEAQSEIRKWMGRTLIYPRLRSAVSEGCAYFSSSILEGDYIFIDCCTSNICIPDTYIEPRVIIPVGAPLPIEVEVETHTSQKTSYFSSGVFEGGDNRLFYLNKIAAFTVKVVDFPLADAGVVESWSWILKLKLNALGMFSGTYRIAGYPQERELTVAPRVLTLQTIKQNLRSDAYTFSELTIAVKDYLYGSSLVKNDEEFVNVDSYKDFLDTRGHIGLLGFNAKSRLNDYAGADALLATRTPVPDFLRATGYREIRR
ncbi:heat shock protein 70 homolog [Persimmon virus B]|uniref:Heat shock protein 70 homolog n=1 Tax=Persimmon virus B TaxID=1493829 RepID=A0A0A8JCS4_9CLOS|nr:heat shock protein 70 homolog [Persimmon virus B]BAQ08207.1 heat shock protein 70 homolog [Persimmon virus B]